MLSLRRILVLFKTSSWLNKMHVKGRNHKCRLCKYSTILFVYCHTQKSTIAKKMIGHSIPVESDGWRFLQKFLVSVFGVDFSQIFTKLIVML